MMLCILFVGLFLLASRSDAFIISGSYSQSSSLSVLGSTKRGNDVQTTKRKKSKWDRRRQKGNNKKSRIQRRPQQVVPRPVIIDYDEQRNHQVNQDRLSKSINCEHFENCPGCTVKDNVGMVDIIQSAKLFFSSTSVRRNRMDVQQQDLDWVVPDDDDGFYQVVVPSDVTKWRTQAKLAVAPKSSSWSKDGCTFGLYQRGSHTVMPIPSCQVHHPSINRAVDALMRATAKAGTPAFSQESWEGGLRYIQCQVERITGRICLTLVWAASDLKGTQPALSRLTKELNRLEPDLWHSIWCHCNDGQGNNIFSRNSRNWHRLTGLEFVREPLPVGNHGWLYYSPLVFRQGNIDGFDILAIDVAKYVPSGSKVCELYAGVGGLGLTALTYHSRNRPLLWVRCSDENPANKRCFNRSVDSLPRDVTSYSSNISTKEKEGQTIAELIQMMENGKQTSDDDREGSRVSYMVANAAEALLAGQALGAEVLIVDPPRKGLDDAVLQELCKPFNPEQPYVEETTLLTMSDERLNWTNDVRTLLYVSCGFDALARDTDRLLSSRAGWILESATGYVLFPGSDHVETLCVFQRFNQD